MKTKDNSTVEQRSVQKRHKRVKIAIGVSTAIIGVGGGIGAGYAIWHKSNSEPVPPPTPAKQDNISWNKYNPTMKLGDTQTISATSSVEGDVTYSVDDDLPIGVTFDNNTGVLTYETAVESNADVTIKAVSNLGGIAEITITILAPTPTYSDDLSIQGARVLAVPHKTVYEYSCKGGQLIADVDLPSSDFTFDGQTLTYIGVGLPTQWYTFHLISTANDGSGKTNRIEITCAPVSKIESGEGVYILSNQTVVSITPGTDDGTLTLTITDDQEKILMAVYFANEGFDDVTSIGINFLNNCYALTSVDLSGLSNVTSIEDNFLSRCSALTSVDLSPLSNVMNIRDNFLSQCSALTSVDLSSLTEVKSINYNFLNRCSALTSVDLSGLSNITSIGENFLSYCSALTSVDLSPLDNVKTINGGFLNSCSALTSVDLSPLSNVTSIGASFLYGCFALTSVDLSPLSNITSIGASFLYGCRSLTSIDLSPLSNVTSISDGFLYGCYALTSVDLSPFSSVIEIGDNFLGNCYALTSVKIGNISFDENITIGTNAMQSVTNPEISPYNIIYALNETLATNFRNKINGAISNWIFVEQQ